MAIDRMICDTDSTFNEKYNQYKQNLNKNASQIKKTNEKPKLMSNIKLSFGELV